MLMEHGNKIRRINRPFKPYLFSVALTMIIVMQSNAREMDRGTEYPLSVIVTFLAGGAAAALIGGWVLRKYQYTLIGLALVVFAYTTRAVFIQFNNAFDQAVFFSLAAALAAAGAYILEARGVRHELVKEVA